MKQFELKKILIPTDFSDTSLKAIDYAILLAKLTKAHITLLHVVESVKATTQFGGHMEPLVMNIRQLEKDRLTYSKQHLIKFVRELKIENLVKVTPLIVSGRTHLEIIKTAKKINADIIIMGTHGVTGWREFILGSNTYRVVNDSECPVMSVQKHTRKPGFRNILVPFSDQPHSREKVMVAIKFAQLYNATLSVIGIDIEKTKNHFKKIQLEANQIKRIASDHGVSCNVKVFSEGFYADIVLQHAKEMNADLIITMSKENLDTVPDYFTKAFAEQIVNHSPVPVLSIKPEFYTPIFWSFQV